MIIIYDCTSGSVCSSAVCHVKVGDIGTYDGYQKALSIFARDAPLDIGGGGARGFAHCIIFHLPLQAFFSGGGGVVNLRQTFFIVSFKNRNIRFCLMPIPILYVTISWLILVNNFAIIIPSTSFIFCMHFQQTDFLLL